MKNLEHKRLASLVIDNHRKEKLFEPWYVNGKFLVKISPMNGNKRERFIYKSTTK